MPFESSAAHDLRISAVSLRRALIAGMSNVVLHRDLLNKINVFPVPDGDTGSNLAFTMNTILGASLTRRHNSTGQLLREVAHDAVDGARGNSGSILAQFFCGVADVAGKQQRLDRRLITLAVQAGAGQARAALAEPREGTILSVIQAFSNALQSPHGNLATWFGQALGHAQQALADTPKQLAVLRQAGVVDAGAQGFVELLEGIHGFILERRTQSAAITAVDDIDFAGNQWHTDIDASKPWCTECLITGAGAERSALQAALADAGADSVVVAGNAERLRVHAHVAEPAVLFDLASRFGTVTSRKAENMLAQHRAASRRARVAVVTDSASDLYAETIGELPLDVVPVRVSFGNEDFLDRISLSNAEFYRRLREGSALPQTSQPPSGDFRRQFDLLLSHVDEVVYIGLSRQLSGTLQAGESAAGQNGEGRVHVIDSGQVSCAQALLALAAAECAEQGGSVDDVRARLAALSGTTFLFAVARDIEHAVRGGRIPRWVLPLAKRLGLSAIARTRHGKLSVRGALFGRRRIPERFARYVAGRVPENRCWRVMVGHCDAPTDAQRLLDALTAQLDVRGHWLVETGPAIGAHAGPGTLVVGLSAEPDS